MNVKLCWNDTVLRMWNNVELIPNQEFKTIQA